MTYFQGSMSLDIISSMSVIITFSGLGTSYYPTKFKPYNLKFKPYIKIQTLPTKFKPYLKIQTLQLLFIYHIQLLHINCIL